MRLAVLAIKSAATFGLGTLAVGIGFGIELTRSIPPVYCVALHERRWSGRANCVVPASLTIYVARS